MTSYPVGDRSGQLTVGVAFVAGGGLFTLLGLLIALGVIGSDAGWQRALAPVLLCLIGVPVIVVGWGQGWRMPHTLRIGDDGVLHVVRPLRTTRVPIGTIRTIDKVAAKVGVEEADARELRIRHGGGTVPVSYFDQVDRFIADVRARNPNVEVRDGW